MDHGAVDRYFNLAIFLGWTSYLSTRFLWEKALGRSVHGFNPLLDVVLPRSKREDGKGVEAARLSCIRHGIRTFASMSPWFSLRLWLEWHVGQRHTLWTLFLCGLTVLSNSFLPRALYHPSIDMALLLLGFWPMRNVPATYSRFLAQGLAIINGSHFVVGFMPLPMALGWVILWWFRDADSLWQQLWTEAWWVKVLAYAQGSQGRSEFRNSTALAVWYDPALLTLNNTAAAIWRDPASLAPSIGTCIAPLSPEDGMTTTMMIAYLSLGFLASLGALLARVQVFSAPRPFYDGASYANQPRFNLN